MSKADLTFINMCKDILENGISSEGKKVRTIWPSDGKPAHYIYTTNVVNHYDLSDETPMLTIRPTYLTKGIREMRWINQDKSNDVKLLKEKYDIHWWDLWMKDDGTIGSGYGAQMAIKHKYPEGEYDMMDKLLLDLDDKDEINRRMIINMYNHNDLHNMSLPPCAYSTTWNVRGNYLDMILHQRSSDILAANNINVMQYACLLMMVAKAKGYKPGKLTHVIGNAHIYDRHVDIVKEIIERDPRPAPQLFLDTEKIDFYAMTEDDFVLKNYNPHGQVKFEIAQ